MIAASGGLRSVRSALSGQLDTLPEDVLDESRAEFGLLLEAGIEIYEYTPAQLHAKTVIVDGPLTMIGSANLDPHPLTPRWRSSHTRRRPPGAWSARPLAQRVLEWLLEPLRSQL